MSQGLAGVALSRRQRGCAWGGLSPRSLYAPMSQGLAGVKFSRHQRGCADAPMSQGLAGVACPRRQRECAGGDLSPRSLYVPMSQGHQRGCAGRVAALTCSGVYFLGSMRRCLRRACGRSMLSKANCRHLGSSRLNDSRRPQACPQNVQWPHCQSVRHSLEHDGRDERRH